VKAAGLPAVLTRYPTTTGATMPARFAKAFCALATAPACRGVRSSEPLEKTGVIDPSRAIDPHRSATAAAADVAAGTARRHIAEAEYGMSRSLQARDLPLPCPAVSRICANKFVPIHAPRNGNDDPTAIVGKERCLSEVR